MKNTCLVLCGALALLAGPLHGANILWVSFHNPDGSPSANAAGAGFTQAPDIGYTQLLQANGYNVTRLVTMDNATLNASQLNAADLVIISRSVPSGHYQSDAETAFWNGITAPVMSLGGYIIRGGASGNVRLGWMAGDTIPDTTSASISLNVLQPAHPIFDGISLDGGNNTVNPYAVAVNYNGNPQRGISVVTGATAGGGTILATVGSVGDPAFGGMTIGEWQAGSVLNTTPNGGVADVLAGHRLVFLTGSRERDTVSGDTAGIYDLTADGSTMFLNAVGYMAVPEPSTWAMIGLGIAGFALLRARRK